MLLAQAVLVMAALIIGLQKMLVHIRGDMQSVMAPAVVIQMLAIIIRAAPRMFLMAVLPKARVVAVPLHINRLPLRFIAVMMRTVIWVIVQPPSITVLALAQAAAELIILVLRLRLLMLLQVIH
jgi:hypothetical protein